MFQTKVEEKIRARILYAITVIENHAVYGVTWKNFEGPDRPQNKIWPIHSAFWIPKATNTHSQYVIFIAFPRQQLLQERSKMLCLYEHCLSLICGNKMPTRCNRGFYCRSYCLLNMFRAPVCPSSGAQEYYTVGCCLWYFGQTGHITLSSTPDQQLENHSTKYHRQQPL